MKLLKYLLIALLIVGCKPKKDDPLTKTEIAADAIRYIEESPYALPITAGD